LLLPDGRVLSWSGDGTLRVWDVATGEGRAFTSHEREVTGTLLLADGCLLTWGSDRSLRHHTLRPTHSGEAFNFDATVTTVLPTSPGHFFIGDALGRVHFLERVVA
jgi:WD40 repeat protein